MARESIEVRLEERYIDRLTKEAEQWGCPRSTYLRDVLLELLGQDQFTALEYARRMRPRIYKSHQRRKGNVASK